MSEFLKAFSDLMSTRPHQTHRIAEFCPKKGIEQIELSPASPCQNMYSIAKAFTVAAIGMLVDRKILSVNDSVTEALGKFCPSSFNPLWRQTSLHMLLKHFVGLPKNFMDIDCNDAHTFGDDYLSFVMNAPLRADHGTERCYTDAAHYLLSCVVENHTGLPLDSFLWRELFYPLAFRDAAFSHCPKGHAIGATGLFVRVEDLVKLGALYLQGGVWEGQRILSEQWVETVLENEYEFYKVGIGNAYSKGGMLGQNLLIIPEKNRVVAWQAATNLGQEGMEEFACRYDG